MVTKIIATRQAASGIVRGLPGRLNRG